VGIVGAGYIAGVHSAAWRAVSGTFPDAAIQVELKAVADADPERAAALAQAWEWNDTTSDWSTITQNDDVDLVDICVPNHLHAEIAIEALTHGKHVVCEKPLAIDVAGARAMVEASASVDRLAQVCFYYRLWPAIVRAREIIESGDIGEVQHFRGWMLQDYASDPTQSVGWRADRQRAGAGALGDLGSHIADIACYLAGNIDSVCAMTRSTVERGADRDTDDLAACLVRFANDATGVLEASWAMRGHACDLGFDVIGSQGAVRFGWERANELQVLDGLDRGQREFRRVLIGPGIGDAGAFVAVAGQGLGYRDAFTIGFGRVLAAIADDIPSVDPTFQDGLRASEIIAAIQASARGNEWTRIERASE
jgi:predicted dehydrogenase